MPASQKPNVEATIKTLLALSICLLIGSVLLALRYMPSESLFTFNNAWTSHFLLGIIQYSLANNDQLFQVFFQMEKESLPPNVAVQIWGQANARNYREVHWFGKRTRNCEVLPYTGLFTITSSTQ
jgi:hypothetical protein